MPLWTETYSPENKTEMSSRAVEYLIEQNFNTLAGKTLMIFFKTDRTAKTLKFCNTFLFSGLNQWFGAKTIWETH